MRTSRETLPPTILVLTEAFHRLSPGVSVSAATTAAAPSGMGMLMATGSAFPFPQLPQLRPH
jgi:hypothetical protein